MIKYFDHIGIVVANLDDSLSTYKKSFGLEPTKIETYEEVNARIACIPLGDFELHLISPMEWGKGAIGQFLEEKGEGIHHIGLRVERIEQLMERLEKFNTPCMDKKPIEIGDGSKVAFTDPRFTQNVLYELLEKHERKT